VERELVNCETSPADSEPIATGMAFAAAHLWDDPQTRPVACKIICRMAPIATHNVASAISTVYWAEEDYPDDDCTRALLDAIATNPQLFESNFTSDLVEHLANLLPHCRRHILRVCQALVDHRGREIGAIQNAMFAAGPHLVNIAMTLQQFPDTRSEGLSLLESMLKLGIGEAFTILHDIDMRPAAVTRREPRHRRRRRRPARNN
jgi:hypothetical protein